MKLGQNNKGTKFRFFIFNNDM